ncbi:phosphotransferase family protein, partial [Asanoa sp. NPDC050611]
MPTRCRGPTSASIPTCGNLTYHLIAGGDDLVLRRPPLGHVLATAHD